VFRSLEGERQALAAYDAAMRLWPVPFEHRDVATDFGSTHVIVSGPEGSPALVLLHCALMTSAIWSPVIGDLSGPFRSYAVDVLGDFGRSVPTNPPKTEVELAAWLGQALDRLGLARVCLLGWSFGGFVATNFAAREPRRVERLALLAPFATFVRPGPGFLAGFVPLVIRTRGASRWFERRLCERGSFGVAEHSELLFQRFKNGRVLLKTPPRVLGDEEVRRLTMPTLLLVGANEFLDDGPRAVARARRLLPNGDADLVAECNHAMVSDQTALIRDRLLAFLRGQAPR
jgi:pimeloyl-ACP methyl ester carboxylesterase